MKILWMSDSPESPSGYANVARFVCAGLATRGHDVSVIGLQTCGRTLRWHGCTIYPRGQHDFGADVLLNHLKRLRPHVLITSVDFWRLTYIANPALASFMHE